jgi:alpha-L-rhamnosidase
MDVLCENGRKDIAYRLLYQTECPSWLYEVERGATTIWESWDAISPNGHVNTASFNHYAFGCVGDWMYRFIAGLNRDQAGYKHIRIQPDLAQGLTFAKASYQSIYGEILSAWELEQDWLTLHVTIPPNTTASVYLPLARMATVIESGAPLQNQPGVLSIHPVGPDVGVELGSGTYQFQYSPRRSK